MDRSNSQGAGPNGNSGNSAYNGTLGNVRHDYHCACSWCLQGHK